MTEAAQIPSLWRIELLHPLTVHFPIVLLILVASVELFRLLSVFRRRADFAAPLPAGNIALILFGIAATWFAIYSGKQAEDVVNRVICDPTVTQAHEEFAYLMAYCFSTAGLVALLLRFVPFFRNQKTLARLATSARLVCIFAGVYFLIRTGHLGASLVYQQGAAVYRPTAECSEFSE